jgi:hypothetical protein
MHWQRLAVRGWPWLTSVALVSFGLNYIWEMAQMPAFTTGRGQPFPSGIAFAFQHCFIPTLGDVLVACGTLVAGWMFHRRVDWIRQLTKRDLLFISLTLVVVAILVEVVNVQLLHRWGYSSLMPVVPALGVGLLPLVQLALLTLLTFWIVGRVFTWSERGRA